MALSFEEFLKQRQSGKSTRQIAEETPKSYGAQEKTQPLSFEEFQAQMQQGKSAVQEPQLVCEAVDIVQEIQEEAPDPQSQ